MRRKRWITQRQRSRVVVYTTEDQVLDGVLVDAQPDAVILADVRVKSDGDVALAGQIYVPRERVRFIQAP